MENLGKSVFDKIVFSLKVSSIGLYCFTAALAQSKKTYVYRWVIDIRHMEVLLGRESDTSCRSLKMEGFVYAHYWTRPNEQRMVDDRFTVLIAPSLLRMGSSLPFFFL